MNLILVIGHTGQGKSTFTQKLIAGKLRYVFDVNNEYKDLQDDRNGYSTRMRNVNMNMQLFVSNCAKLKNTNCVFEDATGFLKGALSKDVSRLFVAKRHTGNNYILLFHSINRVPPEIMEMSNVVVLFKTNDNLKTVDQKFKNTILNQYFTKVKKAPKFTHYTIRMI